MEIFTYKSKKRELAAFREWVGALGFTVDPVAQSWVNEFDPPGSAQEFASNYRRVSSIVVDVDRESPYNFGRQLREAVGSEYDCVFLTSAFYWCCSGEDGNNFSYCRSTNIYPLSLEMFQSRLAALSQS